MGQQWDSVSGHQYLASRESVCLSCPAPTLGPIASSVDYKSNTDISWSKDDPARQYS
ncbi:Hypothetical predicted protein, partial [Pelobates cultripes]